MSSNRPAAALALGFLLLGTACSNAPSSVAPTPYDPSRFVLPTPQAGPPNASLEATTLEARVVTAENGLGSSSYLLRLVLRETGGHSGAYVWAPDVTLPDGQVRHGCSEELYRIRVGGRLEFHTLDGCVPLLGSYEPPVPGKFVVTVRFMDDDGRQGVLTGSVEVMP